MSISFSTYPPGFLSTFSLSFSFDLFSSSTVVFLFCFTLSVSSSANFCSLMFFLELSSYSFVNSGFSTRLTAYFPPY
ncbi:hypothetical protein, partial [Staphylococcus aureus]